MAQPQPLVTFVIPTLHPFGGERTIMELAARLPSRGFRTRLLTLFNEGTMSKELRERNIRWGMIAESRQISRWELVQRLRSKLFEDLERVPEIVHTSMFGSDFWTMAARYTSSLDQTSRPLFVSAAQNVDRDDSTLRRMARAWAVRRMDYVTTVSEEVSQYCREDLGVKAERLRFLQSGINLSHLALRGSAPFHDVPRLLMVGRLERQKGHETVLRALANIQRPWQLSIAGSGSLLRELKELAERLGIASRTNFLGERTDVPHLLSSSDLFLFPSRWEGLGLSVLEAAASGLPVWSSDLSSVRDFVPTERRLPVDDVTRWQEAIAETLANPSPALHKAGQLASDVRGRYDVEAMVDRYAEFYRSVLGEKRSGR